MVTPLMLVALGFLSAVLLILLMAPIFWRRAVKLTTKRLKASLPMTMAEIGAQRDQLRADYAIQIRKLEVAHERLKEKSANQLVDLNRNKMEVRKLRSSIRDLRASLAEKNSMATVLRHKVADDMPRLEEDMRQLRVELSRRHRQLSELKETVTRQREQLTRAERAEQTQYAEAVRLRKALTSSLSATTRVNGHGEIPADAELIQENERLAETLAKLRKEVERLRQFEEVEASLLKQHMQKLGSALIRQANPSVQGKAIAQPVAAEEKTTDSTGKNQSHSSKPAKSLDANHDADNASTERQSQPKSSSKKQSQKTTSRGSLADRLKNVEMETTT